MSVVTSPHGDLENADEAMEDADIFKEDEIENDAANSPPPAAADQSMMDDSDTCPICFESWTTSGPHRICCLKCGHLFGKSCIMKWLMSTRPKPGTCPQCNHKAQTKDIRVLYCKRVKATDTTDRDRALEDLEVERKLRRKVELELSECKFKLQLACSDAENLREELSSLKACISASQTARGVSNSVSLNKPHNSESSNGSYTFTKSLTISQTGQCRVLAPCDYINLLCVSQTSPNALFKGYGITKLHIGEMRTLKYIHLHSQPIRDLAFHPEQQDAIVASASMDKALKLTSLLVDSVVQTYQCSSPIWSCCWAYPSPNYLFAGCGNGSVYLFDIRITSRPVSMFGISPSSTAPVVSLLYVPPDPNHPTFPAGGLLAGQLTQVSFLEEAITAAGEPDEERRYRSFSLPLEGSLVSLSSFPEKRDLFLASYRPSTRIPRVRHLCTRLTAASLGYDCEQVASLYGGSQMRMLSRARLFRKVDSEQTLAVSGDDDANGALIWDCETSCRTQTLGVANATTLSTPVIDVCTFGKGEHLALLTERQVDLFRWSRHNSDS